MKSLVITVSETYWACTLICVSVFINTFPPLFRSENYLVRWSSSGLVKDIDQLHNLRAVFTVRILPVSPALCSFV